MADSIANLILRIISQKGQATSDVDELAASLEALDHTKATAEAGVDTEKGSFDQLQLELDKFDHKDVKAKAGVDTKDGEAQLQLFTHSLENLASKSYTGKFFSAGDIGQFTQPFGQGQQLSMDVGLDKNGVAKTEAEVVALHEQLQLELDANKLEIKTDVDTSKIDETERAASTLVNALGTLSQAGGQVGGALSGLGDNLSKVGFNLGAFSVRLTPVVAGALALAVVIGVSLVAALASVAASAVLAAGALGAMGVAFLGALGPIAALAIPVALAFGKVISALTQSQTSNTAATRANTVAQQQAIQAQSVARAYAEQRASAEQALTLAVQNAATARAAAYREEQDAIQAVKDAVLALNDAEDAAAQSKLDFEKAKQALIDFRSQLGLTKKDFDVFFNAFKDVGFDPTKLNAQLKKVKFDGVVPPDQELQLEQLILNVKKARDGEADSTNAVTKAQTTLNRARQDEQPFLKEGILGSKNYQAALAGVASAQKNLTQLESDHAFQLQQTAKLNALNAASAATAASKTAGLTAEEKKLYDVLKLVIGAFNQAFGPAVNAVLDGFIAGFKTLGPLVSGLKGPMTDLGKAMGASITDFFKILTGPSSQKLFLGMIEGAKQLLPYVNKIFAPMLDLMGKIATAAMPLLIVGFQSIAGWLQGIDKSTGIKDISNFIQKNLVPALNAWVKLALQLIPAFFQFIIDIAPQGEKFLGWVTEVAKQFLAWASSKKGMDQIRDFFSKAVPAAITFLKAFGAIVGFFLSIPKWVYIAVAAFAALVAVFIAASAAIALLTSPIGLIILAVAALAAGLIWAYHHIAFMKDALDAIGNAFKAALSFKWVGPALDWIKNAFNNIINFLKGLPGKFLQWGKDIIDFLWKGIQQTGFDIKNGSFYKEITWLINFLVGLPDKFFNWGKDIISGLWNGIKSVSLDVWGWITGAFNDTLKFLEGLPDKMFNLGWNLIQGLFNGIKSIGSKIGDFLKGLIPGPLKSFFKIFSPSKLMMDIGMNIGKGLEVGIEASGKGVQRAAMNNLVFPVAAAAGATGSRSGITIQNQNVNLPAAPGYDQMGDPRHQAALFAREMQRRGWR
jgi:phage-related protein